VIAIRTVYKRTAYLLDDGVLLHGYTSKRKFFPDNKDCGFSYQKIRKRDIDRILFYDFKKIKIRYAIAKEFNTKRRGKI
jgi:hypothetical protein